MDPLVTSSLISAGTSLLGGLFGGGQSNNKARKLGIEQLTDQRRSQEILDRERPTWVADGARKAGISPLVAMGMQPVSVGGVSVGGDGGDSHRGQMLADMGQNLGRAAEAYLTQDQRAQQKVVDRLALERAGLENDLLRSQISAVNRTAATPGLPSPSSQVLPGQPYNPELDIPVSQKGTHLDYGPLVNADAVDFDSDPIGYLAARGIISSHDLKTAWSGVKDYVRRMPKRWGVNSKGYRYKQY